VHNFMEGQTSIQGGLKAFVNAVKDGTYPLEEHSYR
jgi:3-methyl-2-oxobutanoate hydroxymethyltransferase